MHDNDAPMPKKKLLIITAKLIVGGVERALLELLNNIDTEMYSVTLLLTKKGGALEYLIPSYVEVRYLSMDMQAYRRRLLRQFHWIQLLKTSYYRIATHLVTNYCGNVYHAVKSWPDFTDEFDCVIAYKADDALVASLPSKFRATHRFLWVHAEFPDQKKFLLWYRRIIKDFSHVICVSNSIKGYVEKFFSNVNKQNISVIHNLFNIDNILSKSNVCNSQIIGLYSIVTVGRLSPEKGQQMIPATVRLLLDAGYDVYWYLVGDGSLREEIECECVKHNVTDHVILLGTQMNPYPYIKNCDIYVQPSFSEGYCTTTVEAKILQKPIVTTDAPGMREQFTSGENGLIVDAMTPEALFEGIKTLLDHPELCQKFVDNLKHESFDNNAELQKLYDFIEN